MTMGVSGALWGLPGEPELSNNDRNWGAVV